MKADLSRDYYADLELPPTADIADIKKQFRKLALKYHPDRNPGKEAEVNHKFQTIQSAHEILTNPEQKTKYDNNRTRSRYPTASGVRGNPWSDVASQYPRPPQRPPMPTRPSAASRYSSWATPNQKSPRDDPNVSERMRAWDRMRPGSSGKQSQTPQGTPGTAPTAQASPRKPTRPTEPPPPPPRTEFQRKKQAASFGNKKTNFTQPVPDEPPAASSYYFNAKQHPTMFKPATATKEPELPPRSSDHLDPMSARFKPTFVDSRQRTPYASHGGEKFNPFDGTSVNRAKSVRDGLRDAQNSPNSSRPPSPPLRRRSASVPDEADNMNQARASFSRAGDRYTPRDQQSTARNAPFAEQQQPASNLNGASTAGTSSKGNQGPSVYASPSAFLSRSPESLHALRSETFMSKPNKPGCPGAPLPSPHLRPAPVLRAWPFSARCSEEEERLKQARARAAQLRPPPMRPVPLEHEEEMTRSRSAYPNSYCPSFQPNHAADEGKTGHLKFPLPSFTQKELDGVRRGINLPAAQEVPVCPPLSQEAIDAFRCNTLRDVYSRDPRRATPKASESFEERQQRQLQTLISNKKRPRPYDDVNSSHKTTTQKKSAEQQHADGAPASRFEFNVDDDMLKPTSPQNRFMRKSADSINTRFVADEFVGADWKFHAGGGPTEDAFLAAKQRAHAKARPGRQSPIKTRSPTKDGLNFGQGSTSDPELRNPGSQPQQTQSAFNAAQWTEIGPEAFVPQTPRGATASPTKLNRPMKKSKHVKMTAGTAGMVDEDDSSSNEEKTRPGPSTGFTGNNSVPTPTDSPIAMDIDTPPNEPAPPVPQPKTARAIPLEPSKPEWRPGFVAGVPTAESKPMPPPVPPHPDRPGSANNPIRLGSEDTEDLMAGSNIFANFKNVAPFAPTVPAGLESMGDLGSAIPFPSKAATRLAVDKEKDTSRPLPFPPVPKSPRPPTVLAISHLKPPADAWQKYVHEFRAYAEEWADFNARVTAHFEARKNLIEQSRLKTGFSWIEARGDAGIRKYLEWIEEDKIVRQKWMAACEAHELRVREFLKYREKMLQ